MSGPRPETSAAAGSPRAPARGSCLAGSSTATPSRTSDCRTVACCRSVERRGCRRSAYTSAPLRARDGRRRSPRGAQPRAADPSSPRTSSREFPPRPSSRPPVSSSLRSDGDARIGWPRPHNWGSDAVPMWGAASSRWATRCEVSKRSHAADVPALLGDRRLLARRGTGQPAAMLPEVSGSSGVPLGVRGFPWKMGDSLPVAGAPTSVLGSAL